jgi:hypothetical protein
MENCFTIFMKNGQIAAICFDDKQSKAIAKQTELYDTIYICLPYESKYNERLDCFYDA